MQARNRECVLTVYPGARCRWSKRRKCYFIDATIYQHSLPGIGLARTYTLTLCKSAITAQEAWEKVRKGLDSVR